MRVDNKISVFFSRWIQRLLVLLWLFSTEGIEVGHVQALLFSSDTSCCPGPNSLTRALPLSVCARCVTAVTPR